MECPIGHNGTQASDGVEIWGRLTCPGPRALGSPSEPLDLSLPTMRELVGILSWQPRCYKTNRPIRGAAERLLRDLTRACDPLPRNAARARSVTPCLTA
jgi:hypothetical protein